MALDPLTIAAIGAGVGRLFGGFSAKRRENSRQKHEERQYNDAVQQYYAQAAAEEEDRQRRLALYTAFAKGNNLDSALTPEVLALLSKPKSVVAPTPYRREGVPGFWLDMLGTAVETGAAAYGGYKARQMRPDDIVSRAGLGSRSAAGRGRQWSPFMNFNFGRDLNFGGMPSPVVTPWR